MRYKVSSIEYLKSQLAELHDDPSKHWSEYPCLEWDRGRSLGYGVLGIPGSRKLILAHRAAYEITHGVKLERKIGACHHCDNPACFRPIHLFAGTQLDNMRDCSKKKRTHKGFKLTADQVRNIRAAENIPGRTLAAMYGVSAPNICAIRQRRSWPDLM